MTPLHYAALSGSESTVKALVKHRSELTMAINVSVVLYCVLDVATNDNELKWCRL